MAKIDWARVSGGTLKNGDKLLKDLAAGKEPAFAALAEVSVGKPLAAVLVPHLVALADKPLALRLLASIADALDPRDARGTKRVTDVLKKLPVADLLADKRADVRAATALLADKKAVKAALANETDARAKVCMLTALGDAKVAKSYLGDKDFAVAAAAATITKDIDVLTRAIGDAKLDDMPWPGRSLRALAAHSLLGAAFPKKLKGEPSKAQIEVIRALFAVDNGAKLVMHSAFELGLPTRIETVRRLAGIPEPAPEGWVLGVDVTVDGQRDSAYGHWIGYMGTGEGDANAIATAIADTLDAKQCAQALLEVCKSNYSNRFEGELEAPPLPKGGKQTKGDSWIKYKDQREDAVAEAYAQQLAKAGWTIISRCYDPGDATNTPDARLVAFRNGLEIDGTFYRDGKAGASVSVDVSPELFPAFVAAAFERHGKAFATALAALPKQDLKPWGNVGYWLPYAALLIAQRSKTVPDDVFDDLVIAHQGDANVLLPNHIAYLDLLPSTRRETVVAGILEHGHRSLAKMYPSDKALAAAAKGLAATLNSYSTYDDARRKLSAQPWAFIGDHAVPVIEKALAKKQVGNPDFAAQILVEIGTPAAKKALAKLAKHPDATVKKIVKTALVADAGR